MTVSIGAPVHGSSTSPHRHASSRNRVSPRSIARRHALHQQLQKSNSLALSINLQQSTQHPQDSGAQDLAPFDFKRDSYLARAEATARSQARIASILAGNVSSPEKEGKMGAERDLPPLPPLDAEEQEQRTARPSLEREILEDDDEENTKHRGYNDWTPTYSTFGYASTDNLRTHANHHARQHLGSHTIFSSSSGNGSNGSDIFTPTPTSMHHARTYSAQSSASLYASATESAYASSAASSQLSLHEPPTPTLDHPNPSPNLDGLLNAFPTPVQSTDNVGASAAEVSAAMLQHPYASLRKKDSAWAEGCDDAPDNSPPKGLKRLTLTSNFVLEKPSIPARSPWRINKPLPPIEPQEQPPSSPGVKTLARRNSLPADIGVGAASERDLKPSRSSMQVMINASQASWSSRQLLEPGSRGGTRANSPAPYRAQSRLSTLQYRRSSTSEEAAGAARLRAQAMTSVSPGAQRPIVNAALTRPRAISLYSARNGLGEERLAAEGRAGDDQDASARRPESAPLGMYVADARASMPDMFDWRLREEIGRVTELVEQHKAEIQRLNEAVQRLTRDVDESPYNQPSNFSPCLTTGSGEREWINDDGSTRSANGAGHLRSGSMQSFPSRKSISYNEEQRPPRPASSLESELLRRAKSCDKLARLTGETVLASPSISYGVHARTGSTFSVDNSALPSQSAQRDRKSIQSWLGTLVKSSGRHDRGQSDVVQCFQDIQMSRDVSHDRVEQPLRSASSMSFAGRRQRRSFFGTIKAIASKKERGGRGSSFSEKAQAHISPNKSSHLDAENDGYDFLDREPDSDPYEFQAPSSSFMSKARSVPNLLNLNHEMSAFGLTALPTTGAHPSHSRNRDSTPSTASSWLSRSASSSSVRPRGSSIASASTTATSPPTSPLRGPNPPSSYHGPGRGSPVKTKTHLPTVPQYALPSLGGGISEAPTHSSGVRVRRSLSWKALAGRRERH